MRPSFLPKVCLPNSEEMVFLWGLWENAAARDQTQIPFQEALAAALLHVGDPGAGKVQVTSVNISCQHTNAGHITVTVHGEATTGRVMAFFQGYNRADALRSFCAAALWGDIPWVRRLKNSQGRWYYAPALDLRQAKEDPRQLNLPLWGDGE